MDVRIYPAARVLLLACLLTGLSIAFSGGQCTAADEMPPCLDFGDWAEHGVDWTAMHLGDFATGSSVFNSYVDFSGPVWSQIISPWSTDAATDSSKSMTVREWMAAAPFSGGHKSLIDDLQSPADSAWKIEIDLLSFLDKCTGDAEDGSQCEKSECTGGAEDGSQCEKSECTGGASAACPFTVSHPLQCPGSQHTGASACTSAGSCSGACDSKLRRSAPVSFVDSECESECSTKCQASSACASGKSACAVASGETACSKSNQKCASSCSDVAVATGECCEKSGKCSGSSEAAPSVVASDCKCCEKSESVAVASDDSVCPCTGKAAKCGSACSESKVACSENGACPGTVADEPMDDPIERETTRAVLSLLERFGVDPLGETCTSADATGSGCQDASTRVLRARVLRGLAQNLREEVQRIQHPVVFQRQQEPEQTPPEHAPAMRESSRELDEIANRLEELELYEQADRVRELATEFRLCARSMNSSAESRIHGVPAGHQIDIQVFAPGGQWKVPVVPPPFVPRVLRIHPRAAGHVGPTVVAPVR